MQMGHTKVFLRRRVFEALEYLRNQKLGVTAIVIQKHVRRFLAQLHYYDAYMAAITIQCFARRISAIRRFFMLLEYDAATTIQSAFRRFFAETELMAARLIAHFCQTYRRGSIARKVYALMRVENLALVLQRAWRRYSNRSAFVRLQRASIVLQCFWRRRLAVREIKLLRLEARDLGAVAAERDRFKKESLGLRKEVERLRRVKNSEPQMSNDEEVGRLRREVEKLQMALTQSQAGSSMAGFEGLPDSVSVRTTPSWSFGRVFGMKGGDTASEVSASSFSPMPVIKRAFSRNGGDNGVFESPRQPRKKLGEITPTSVPSKAASPGISSSSISLLDAERYTEVADYQLHNISDSPSKNLSRIYTTTTMPPPSPKADVRHFAVDPTSLSERRGFQFSEELQRLHDSILDNDTRLMNDILKSTSEAHALVNEAGDNGRTALHIAIATGNLKLARILIEKGAIANAQDYDGETALHLAEGAPMTNLLLEIGKANPNIPNIDGICALHLAVQRMDAGSVRTLLKHNAKVDIADNTRWFTPLHLATFPGIDDHPANARGRTIIVDLLCGGDQLDLNEKDREGNTPLHYAVQIETADAGDVVNTLLEKGADPRMANSRNQQPLLLLCHNQALRREDVYQECLHSMLFHGADPNQQSDTGCTPLHLSLYHKDIDSAVQLVNRAAELHLLWRKVSHILNNRSSLLSKDLSLSLFLRFVAEKMDRLLG
jgi:ankyrin repeat protein